MEQTPADARAAAGVQPHPLGFFKTKHLGGSSSSPVKRPAFSSGTTGKVASSKARTGAVRATGWRMKRPPRWWS
eukprot:scaffold5229_cov102-Isochrysis_galbana.AAC.5